MGLREVMLEELRDLYSAENQLVKALPKFAKAAEDEELQQAFSEHLEETKGQVDCRAAPKSEKCADAVGLRQLIPIQAEAPCT
jgi:ferritin-like metal-binding protein YciE